ncbi:TolB-like translocation protein [Aquimarina rhabdastrellae]
MIYKRELSLLILIISLTQSFAQQNGSQDNFPVIEDRYLGQKTPGLTPEVFAPGIVSTKDNVESLFTFSPDMKEFFFKRKDGGYKKSTLFVMRYKNREWSQTSILSTDIDKYRERFTPGLSETKKAPLKDIPFTGFSASSNGTYYFYFMNNKGDGHMSYSRFIDGKYEPLQKMNKEINSGKYIAHPFIAPDESYLMWDAEKDGKNIPDIYISFKQDDGSWGKAIKMGDNINTEAYEQRPRVTPDGKYLFFWRGDKKVRKDGSKYWVGSPYWVDAKIIENLRPK